MFVSATFSYSTVCALGLIQSVTFRTMKWTDMDESQVFDDSAARDATAKETSNPLLLLAYVWSKTETSGSRSSANGEVYSASATESQNGRKATHSGRTLEEEGVARLIVDPVNAGSGREPHAVGRVGQEGPGTASAFRLHSLHYKPGISSGALMSISVRQS